MNAGVTYQRLPRVAAAAATTAITMTAYHPVAGSARRTAIATRAPAATATSRPTLRSRCMSRAGRITSSAAAHAQPTCWKSSRKPIAAADAPAAPSRTPYPSVTPAAAPGGRDAGGGRSGHRSDTPYAYTDPATIRAARPAASEIDE